MYIGPWNQSALARTWDSRTDRVLVQISFSPLLVPGLQGGDGPEGPGSHGGPEPRLMSTALWSVSLPR